MNLLSNLARERGRGTLSQEEDPTAERERGMTNAFSCSVVVVVIRISRFRFSFFGFLCFVFLQVECGALRHAQGTGGAEVQRSSLRRKRGRNRN